MQSSQSCAKRAQRGFAPLPRQRQHRGVRQLPVCQAAATISETRKLLASRGWQRAWIDQVTERINREQVFASEEQMTAVIDALEELGFEPAQIEHICTIAWQLLDFEPAKIKAVAEYVKQQGVDDPKPVLFNNPKLLEYEVQGDELVKGKRARARVTLDKSNGTDSLLVSWYTANTAFAEESAPIAPWRPS